MSDKKEKTKVEEEVVEQNNEEKVEIATNLNISEDVIGIIAGLAASEVEGIAGMTLGFVDGINQILGSSKKYSKGVKIELDGKKVTVDIFVNVKYGVRIPDVAFEIQNRVKKAVESMTGLKVVDVNVHVQGVNTDSNNVEEEKTEDSNKTE